MGEVHALGGPILPRPACEVPMFSVSWSVVPLIRTGLIGLALLLLLASCGGMAGGGGSSGSSNVITREDIQARIDLGTYEIVRQLRPTWVRARGRPSFSDPNAGMPVVYLDQTFYGPIDFLRQIDAGSVDRIEYLSATDATTRYGTGHMGGIVMVTTTRGG